MEKEQENKPIEKTLDSVEKYLMEKIMNMHEEIKRLEERIDKL